MCGIAQCGPTHSHRGPPYLGTSDQAMWLGEMKSRLINRAGWSCWLVALCVAGSCLSLVWPPSAHALLARGHVFATTFAGEGASKLSHPAGVAVDESSGDVYVADRSSPQEQVERFAPNGKGGYEVVSAFAVKSPAAIAVDNSSNPADPSRGDVYVVGALEADAGPEEHSVLYKYDPQTGKLVFKKSLFRQGSEELALEEVFGVAVDASGAVWVYWGEEGIVSGFDDQEVNRWQPALTKELKVAERTECRARPGFAVSAHDEFFYLARERENGLEECAEEEAAPVQVEKFAGSGQLLARGLDRENTSAVAVDGSSGDVYADNLSSVAAFAAAGEQVERFGAGELRGGGAVAVDSARDTVFVAEPARGRVAVFSPEGAHAPSVDGVVAQNLTPTSERLIARIDPGGLGTHYYFQYGSASCVADPAACTDVPALPGGDLSSGFGDQSASVEVGGLSPDTTYFYRVVAQNRDGSTESPQEGETFFTTLPSAEGVLLDHRRWEMVSPAEKHGATIEPISREGALIQASADGNAISWTASAPVSGQPEGNRRPEPVQVISSRDATEGWSSKDITSPHDKGEGYEPGEASEYRFFSPDLSPGDRATAGPQRTVGKPSLGTRSQGKDDLHPQRPNRRIPALGHRRQRHRQHPLWRQARIRRLNV